MMKRNAMLAAAILAFLAAMNLLVGSSWLGWIAFLLVAVVLAWGVWRYSGE